MVTPQILITVIREIFVKSQIPREPEPSMVMDDPEHVQAFFEAGDGMGPMAGIYLFNVAHATQVLHGAKKVIDLGCGPARLLGRMAKINPEISFLGIDLSDEMLASAKDHIADQGIQNVELKKGDITDLNFLSDHSVDGVMSTLALHHLPTQKHLRACFKEANRILAPEGRVYFFDLGRMRSLYSILAFAYRNAKNQPHAFTLDSERSWRAAFLPEDFENLALTEMSGRNVKISATWPSPAMMMLKTRDQIVAPEKIENLKTQMRNLDSPNQQDVRNLSLFFRCGGLRKGIL